MNGKLSLVFKEADKGYKIIYKTYKLLEKSYELKIPIHSAGKWILDNMYIIEEVYEDIKADARILKNKTVPVIKKHDGTKHIAIFYLAYELVEQNTGYLNSNIILNSLKEYQKLSYLTSEEIDLFMLCLKVALIKFIARICLNISNSQIKKIEVENILSSDFSDEEVTKKLAKEFKSFRKFKEEVLDTSKIKNTNTAYVEYMAYRLKEHGQKGEKYFKILKNEANKIGFTIEEAIVKEHKEIAKTTDYIGRAICSFKTLNGINFRDIFERVNKIDETLKDDYTLEFEKSDFKTKTRYRNYIIKIAKKYNLSEVYVAKKAVECSHKYKKHVGFFLVGSEKYLLKKQLNKSYVADLFFYRFLKNKLPAIYILTDLLLSLLITLGIVKLLDFSTVSLNVVVKVIYCILTYILSMEILDKVLNFILGKFIHPKILPRFDFAKNIDSKYPTYVVMPCVISSLDKLDEMIKKMEVTYLANRTENMYYMLLGDCIASDKEIIPLDEKIVEFAKEKLDKLNEKYKSDIKLFNFMYRKRIYSKGEGVYMGWERKRGGLTHFNKLVLGKLTADEKNRIMTLLYDKLPKVKYAIVVDEDTQLSLNTAKDLVGIISHPLNRPVLSSDKRRVISGYGLIQPSVGLDIEPANKSLFSKIFGGFGGLDIYTNAVSNMYQDVFKEAIFCGKGIYDIELFEQIVAPYMPENLILSHDLLEGSILRTALASDVEVQDGFPSNYIAYMKRNHRWYRGDMQIIRWLLSRKSQLNTLSKWKIFDNLRRPMVDVFLLLYLVISAFLMPNKITFSIIFVFITINFGYLISLFMLLIHGKKRYNKEQQYIPIIHGVSAQLLTMCFNFVTMPYKAYVCLNAFIKSIYRMLISKKHLLEWTTSEIVDKMAKSSLGYYVAHMILNILFGVIFLIPLFTKNIDSMLNRHMYIFLFVAFMFAPVLAYLLGKDHLIKKHKKLDKEKQKDILEVAKKTWSYFDMCMSKVNNFLPSDNFQENRRYKIANRTSSTDIGFGILAIISAYDLKFITKEDALIRLNNIYSTIQKLEKWNGHLYNWYNIKNLEPLRPRFVSSVDSGNYVACLYVAKEFLEDLKQIAITEKNIKEEEFIDKLIVVTDDFIEQVDFTALYNKDRNLFSIGYDCEAGRLVDSYYDLLMSEARTTSLIAIARRQVTSKHWFSLGRNLVKVDGYIGLKSWAGTAFEYFMTNIFTKSYEHTLIDQSLFFAKYSQIKFAKKNNVAWGISESAYAIKDSELNYQYKEFGIPWLGLKRGLNDSLVISPYSSILMLNEDEEKVYKNMQRLKSIGMYSTYGFYEAIDYTKENLSDDKTQEIIKTYMAHHQGMILASINNYLNSNIIKERFHKNADIKAAEILLKEREKMTANIKKNTKSNENIFKQKDNNKYGTYINCTYANKEQVTSGDQSSKLSVGFLKGDLITATLTNFGAEFINYKNKIVNRQRYTALDETGNYIYITDKTTGKCFSATNCDIHSVYNKDTEKCSFVNTLNQIEFYIQNSEIESSTIVAISQKYNAVIKKVTLYNNTKDRREIVINTCIEPSLTDFMTNIVHPSFNNLLIETYYDEDLDTLIAYRRKKAQSDEDMYVYSKIIGIDLEKQVETEKQKLIKNDETSYSREVSKYPLWPVLSYRASIILDPYERQEFYYIVGAADDKYKISNAIVNLDKEEIEREFRISHAINSVTARYLKLQPVKAEIYNNILRDSLFTIKAKENDIYWNADLKQSMLWKYSISGDFPIILVYIDSIENAGIINEVIEFMDYVKNRKINIDIVVLINEEQKENGPLYTYIKMALDRAVYMDYTDGRIFLLNIKNLEENEIVLLSYLAKKYISDISEFQNLEKSENDTQELITSINNKNENGEDANG